MTSMISRYEKIKRPENPLPKYPSIPLKPCINSLGASEKYMAVNIISHDI
jgi:hypothetical protein